MSDDKKQSTRAERLAGKQESKEPLFPNENESGKTEATDTNSNTGNVAESEKPAGENQPGANPSDGNSFDQPTAEDIAALNLDADDFDARMAALADKKNPLELTANFLTKKLFKDGESKNFFFMGWTKMPDSKTGEMKPAVRLIGEGKESFVCMSAVILQSLESIDEKKIPVPIRILSHGMKEGKENNYWNVQVFQL